MHLAGFSLSVSVWDDQVFWPRWTGSELIHLLFLWAELQSAGPLECGREATVRELDVYSSGIILYVCNIRIDIQ